MNRVVIAIVMSAGVCLAAGSAGAEEQAWWAKGAKGGEAKPAAPAAAATNTAAIELARAMQEWQAKLAGSRWELEVVVSGPGQPRVVEADVLSFDQGSVGSEVLSKAGFEPASFSLYPPEGQSISWEAMQRKTGKDGEESAIWRGEVTGEKMQGTMLRRHPGKGGAEGRMDQFAFTGRKMAPAPVPVPLPAAEVPAPDPLEPGAPKQP